MAKKSTKKKRSRTARKPGPARPDVAVAKRGVAMEVRPDMSLMKPPLITASKGDAVFWEITNNFKRKVNVHVKSFKFKDNGFPIFRTPINFRLQDVDVPAAGFGMIEGTVQHNVRNKKQRDLIKYSIVVTDVGVAKGAKDTYDPDLEVPPPPPDPKNPGGSRRPWPKRPNKRGKRRS